MNKLAMRDDLIRMREECVQAAEYETKLVLVCGGTGCVSGGSLDIYAKLKELMEEKGLPVDLDLAEDPHREVIGIKKSGCHGFCEQGPLVRIEPQGWLYCKVKVEDCEEIVEKSVIAGEPVERLAYSQNGKVYMRQEDIPFYHKQTRHMLEHCSHSLDRKSVGRERV